MALTYNTWFQTVFNTVAAVSTATPINPLGVTSSYTDPFWQQELQNMIDYGEQRCFRDLDLLAWRVTDTSGLLTATQRTFALPTSIGVFRKLELISVITNSTDPIPSPLRNTLLPQSRAYMAMAWPSNSTYNGLPMDFAMQDNATVIVGPTPDQSYPVECVGTQTPTPLSFSNQSTFLSTMLPDLFFSATMIKASAYMRDFSQMSENPAMSVSWEAQYEALLKSADVEEAGRWYRSAGWTSQNPKAVTTPPRS